MSVQQQIAKLESLLTRIRRNAAKGRIAGQGASAEASDAYAVPAPMAEPPEAVAYEAAVAKAAIEESAEDAHAMPTVPPVAAEAAPAEVEELDMADAEIVEIAVDVVEEEAPPLANELAEEPVPESAPRPAAQVVAEEADLEPPVKTPPPESGRQVVAAPVGISGEIEIEGPDAAQGLEADMSGGPISKAPPGEPSAAQLGETVELEGADGAPARIELLSAPMSTPVERAPDDLELSLPQRGFGGGYDAELAPPSRAAEDLARHRDRAAVAEEPPAPASLTSPGSFEVSGVVAVPHVEASPPGIAPPEELVSQPSVDARAAEASPVIVERPPIGQRDVAAIRAPGLPAIPATFLELLDASLAIDV